MTKRKTKHDGPLIHVQELKKEFVSGEILTKVLHGLSFEIARGDFVSIMGPSGSGKSTLMHLLSFLDTPSSGTYRFAGHDVSKYTDDELAVMRNERVGFVFQSFNLLPRTTVKENVMLPLAYSKKMTNGQKETRAKKAVTAVGLEHRMNYFSNQLSGGEKQRVAIARALVNDPDVIFADEPTGNLDSKSGNQILRILQDLNKNGRTIIMVTHEQDTADHSKRILRLKDGQLTSDTAVRSRRFATDGDLRK